MKKFNIKEWQDKHVNNINEGLNGKIIATGPAWSIKYWTDTFEVKSVNEIAEFDIDELDDLIKGLTKLKKIVDKL
jgi:hypothetical protein